MSIINKKIGNATYAYEAIYAGVEKGKRKYKWKLIGKLDENGNIIPSKKRLAEQAKQEVAQKSRETSEIQAFTMGTAFQASSQAHEPGPIEPEIIDADINIAM